MKQIFKQVITDFRTSPLPELTARELKVPLDSGKIITIIGPRRSGKTFYLYQLIKEIRQKDAGAEVLYINFEDDRLNCTAEDLQLLLEAYYEITPDAPGSPYFFFDEIQNVNGWEKFIRRIHDSVTKNIFLTGSSAKLLSREIATALRGRAVSYELLTLSFREYLNFTGFTSNYNSTKGRAKLITAFKRYLLQGGFPETLKMDSELRIRTLQSYLDTMMYRDIIERYQLTNVTALRYFIRKTINSTASKISFNKLFNDLKSQGVKVSKDSIHDFFRYTEDCFLFFQTSLLSESISRQAVNDKKIYTVDNGLAASASFSLSENIGHLLENLVFLHLKSSNFGVHYLSGKGECDFIGLKNEQVESVIQVCLQVTPENYSREISGLIEGLKRTGKNEGYLLTLNTEKEETVESMKIHYLPAAVWMLDYI